MKYHCLCNVHIYFSVRSYAVKFFESQVHTSTERNFCESINIAFDENIYYITFFVIIASYAQPIYGTLYYYPG